MTSSLEKNMFLALLLYGMVSVSHGFFSNTGTAATKITTTAAASRATTTAKSIFFRNQKQKLRHQHDYTASFLQTSLSDDDNEDEEVGKMRMMEIKAELKLRGVEFSDCFDKESMSNRLLDARCKGKADPTIIDQFNQQSLGNYINDSKVEVDDDILNTVAGGDGTLPGGMPPDMMKQLMSNPEVVGLLQDPKMQDVMKVMMTGGQDAMEETMKKDPEIYELVMKLNRIMANAM